MKLIYSSLCLLLWTFGVLLIGMPELQAQDRTISGVVQSNEEEPLIGARVVVKGKNIGTMTDGEGQFELQVPAQAKTLVVSYLGMESQTVKLSEVGEQVTVTLMAEDLETDEVVITALGIAKDEKSLGYSVQKLDNEEIALVKPVNITNAVAGKVAGVYVTGSAAGPTASANINIRGAASLLGNNQPLFVVNGMPVTNELYSFDDGLNGSTTIDFGNAAQVINPDDIASMNILKGPAASALYGSRAANGVILIETKTGKSTQGVGVEFNSNTTFASILRLPDYQNTYGFGGGGKYSYKDGTNYIGEEEYYEAYGENWGPEMNGQDIIQFNSDGEPAPFTPAPDNVRNFFRTGITSINNLALSSADETGDYRLSYTNLANQGIVPNSDLQRNTLQTSIGKRLLDDKLTIRVNAMGVVSESGNVPNSGYDESSSIMYGWLWYPRQVEINDLRDYWEPGQEGIQQRYVEDLWVNNPWFIANENTNSFQSRRLIGNLRASYDITPTINVRFRYGADLLDEQRQYRRAPSTKGVIRGSYREDEITFSETNAELLIGYTSDRSRGSDFNLDLKIGGNIMRQRANILRATNPQLENFGTDPSVYSLNNAASGVLVDGQQTEIGINSLFGLATFSYRSYLYLDATYRQDWNSTLVNPIEGLEGSEYSFGYPSVSLSAVLSEMLNIPASSALTFLKLKANYAEVGNGAPAYSFGNTYTPQPSFGDRPAFTTNRIIADPNLRNERTRAWEAGVDLRMFQNRLRMDITYYDMLSFNQVIFLPTAITSGYDFNLTNGGEIRNRGIELLLTGDIVKQKNFGWSATLNLGRNRAIVESLPDVITSGRYSIVADMFPGDLSGADLEYVAEEGELLGQLYGLGFVRHPETNEIIHQNGLPMLTEEKVSAGSYQPDLRAGLYNRFRFGNFSFGFLFDGQFGGKIYARSHALYNTGGTITNDDDPLLNLSTTEGRTVYEVSGYDANNDPIYELAQEGGVVGPGLKWEDLNEDGEIDFSTEVSENDVAVEPGGAAYTGYFYAYYGNGFNRDNIEAATYDATYVKLRELSLSYTLPQEVIDRTPLASLRVSIIGRNLLLFTQVPTIDPETYSIRNGIFVNGFESTQLPSTRTLGVAVNLGF